MGSCRAGGGVTTDLLILNTMAARFVLLLAAGAAAQDVGGPPPFFQYAKTARWIVHNSTWGTLSTISTRKGLEGRPFGNPNSIADGPTGASTGVPYFYVSGMDQSMIDIAKDKGVSLTLSEAALPGFTSCAITSSGSGDPENPPCARLVISGSFLNISGTEEAAIAERALFSRHPVMATWPSDHSWFFGKLDIADLWMIDTYGGAASIDPKDYFDASL